jgi:hypothetical protein
MDRDTVAALTVVKFYGTQTANRCVNHDVM